MNFQLDTMSAFINKRLLYQIEMKEKIKLELGVQTWMVDSCSFPSLVDIIIFFQGRHLHWIVHQLRDCWWCGTKTCLPNFFFKDFKHPQFFFFFLKHKNIKNWNKEKNRLSWRKFHWKLLTIICTKSAPHSFQTLVISYLFAKLLRLKPCKNYFFIPYCCKPF